MEVCSNCERAIGNLETPCVFNGRVVCFDCNQRLRRQADSKAVPTDHEEAEARSVAAIEAEADKLAAAKQAARKPLAESPRHVSSGGGAALIVMGVIAAIATLIICLVSYNLYQSERYNGYYIAMYGAPHRPEYIAIILGGMLLALVLVIIGVACMISRPRMPS